MNIPVEGNYRNLISETLLNIRRRQSQVKALTEELEAIALTAASFQNVDLKEFHLDVDRLEFTERPKPEPSPAEQAEVLAAKHRAEIHHIERMNACQE